MELELKYILPYGAYGLKGRYRGSKEIWTLDVESTETDYESNTLPLYHFICTQPILRPLSDLTKEIEHNGERFVPIEKIDNHHNFSMLNTSKLMEDPTRYPYTVVVKLLEWHFDIYNGIEDGWAIDINTIE